MTDEKTEADKVREHEKALAKINSRVEAYARSPFWFTVWDLSAKSLNVVFWLLFWSLMTQCHCECVW